MTTGVVMDGRFAGHRMDAYHVESPRRIEVLNRMLEEEPPCPFLAIEPRPATDAEICRVHERGYHDFIRSTAGKERTYLDPDTSAGPLTYETAMLATGGFLRSLDLVMEGRIRNAFALVRPPGHHAEASQARGFCIFNNVAVGAEHLLREHGLRRILVVDWDIHHGNGTQHSFFARRDVLYFSTHQAPFYPGTGAVRDLGDGEGRGFNLNVPLLRGKGDADFLYIFRRILAPIVRRFEPEFILVSAGFDISAGDPLGGMSVTREGFGQMAALLMAMAGPSARDRIAFVLEGGYNLQTLKDGVAEILVRLSGSGPPSPVPEPSGPPATRAEIEPAVRAFGEFWDL